MHYDDWHTVVDVGQHKGKYLVDVQISYRDIGRSTKISEALDRIKNRRGVTTIIQETGRRIPPFIPQMTESHRFAAIERPWYLDAGLFGSFVEYLVKHHLGIRKDSEVAECLILHGLLDVPDHLVMDGEPMEPSARIIYMRKSYYKLQANEATPADICNLSFAHSICMRPSRFDEKEAAKLYFYVVRNELYFKQYLDRLNILPRLDDLDQGTCSKISVGCVVGTIDAILKISSSDRTSDGHARDENIGQSSRTSKGLVIIDFKCCQSDDIDYYRQQLFAYASLHYLRYGKRIIECRVYNFLTGRVFVMQMPGDLGRLARRYIEELGSYCPAHVKLFQAEYQAEHQSQVKNEDDDRVEERA